VKVYTEPSAVPLPPVAVQLRLPLQPLAVTLMGAFSVLVADAVSVGATSVVVTSTVVWAVAVQPFAAVTVTL
jgi:hypothetical protein